MINTAQNVGSLSGAHTLVACLQTAEIKRIHGIAGTSNIGFINALFDKRDEISYAPARHEQVAAPAGQNRHGTRLRLRYGLQKQPAIDILFNMRPLARRHRTRHKLPESGGRDIARSRLLQSGRVFFGEGTQQRVRSSPASRNPSAHGVGKAREGRGNSLWERFQNERR